MYPLVGEVNLHTIDIVNLLVLVQFLDLLQDRIHIGTCGEVDTVLGNLVRRICSTQFAGLHALLGKIGQDESDTYESVAAAVSSRIDDTAIALTADNGVNLAHLGNNVYLAYGSSAVLAACVLVGNIAQSTGRAQVANGITGSVLQDVVGNGNESVLLAIHGAVLAEESQTVHVGVNNECDIVLALLHEFLDFN